MKTRNIILLFGSLILGLSSCRQRDTPATPESNFFSGTFVAYLVKEGNTLVYQKGAVANVVPGYTNYKMTFNSGNPQKVVFTEYTGETFEGVWSYSVSSSILSFSQLSPSPTAGNSLLFKVEKLDRTNLVLSSISPNIKTGNTLNQYTLIGQ